MLHLNFICIFSFSNISLQHAKNCLAVINQKHVKCQPGQMGETKQNFEINLPSVKDHVKLEHKHYLSSVPWGSWTFFFLFLIVRQCEPMVGNRHLSTATSPQICKRCGRNQSQFVVSFRKWNCLWSILQLPLLLWNLKFAETSYSFNVAIANQVSTT